MGTKNPLNSQGYWITSVPGGAQGGGQGRGEVVLPDFSNFDDYPPINLLWLYCRQKAEHGQPWKNYFAGRGLIFLAINKRERR